jgi:hypothetical protein
VDLHAVDPRLAVREPDSGVVSEGHGACHAVTVSAGDTRRLRSDD